MALLGLGAERSRAWAREGSEWQALLVVLRLAWTAWSQDSGTECPFDFEG